MSTQRYVLVSSVFLAMGLTASVLAAHEPPAPPTPAPGDAPRPAGGRQNFEKMLEKYDTNKDGVLEESEVPADTWKRLKNSDKDGNGKITAEEFKATRGGPKPPRPGGPGSPGGPGTPGGPGSPGGPSTPRPGTPPPAAPK